MAHARITVHLHGILPNRRSIPLRSIISWNLKGIFDTWEEKADYAAVTIHPEMQGEDGYADPSELLSLRFTDEDATIDDDEES